MLIGEVLRRRRQQVATKKGADQFRRQSVRRGFRRRSEGQLTERDFSSSFATVLMLLIKRGVTVRNQQTGRVATGGMGVGLEFWQAWRGLSSARGRMAAQSDLTHIST